MIIGISRWRMLKKLRQILTPTVYDKPNPSLVVQPLTSLITPPDDCRVAPTTNPVLDELLKEFGDELLDVTVFDEEAECDPIKDVKELEQLFSMDPLSFSMDVKVHMAIVVSRQQHGMSQPSNPSTIMGMVRREMASPLRYNFNLSFPYHIANSHPNGVYCYFHPHLIPSEGMNTVLLSK